MHGKENRCAHTKKDGSLKWPPRGGVHVLFISYPHLADTQKSLSPFLSSECLAMNEWRCNLIQVFKVYMELSGAGTTKRGNLSDGSRCGSSSHTRETEPLLVCLPSLQRWVGVGWDQSREGLECQEENLCNCALSPEPHKVFPMVWVTWNISHFCPVFMCTCP